MLHNRLPRKSIKNLACQHCSNVCMIKIYVIRWVIVWRQLIHIHLFKMKIKSNLNRHFSGKINAQRMKTRITLSILDILSIKLKSSERGCSALSWASRPEWSSNGINLSRSLELITRTCFPLLSSFKSSSANLTSRARKHKPNKSESCCFYPWEIYSINGLNLIQHSKKRW